MSQNLVPTLKQKCFQVELNKKKKKKGGAHCAHKGGYI